MLSIGIAKGDVMIPTRMMWVELHRSFENAQAVFPVAGVSNHVSEYCRGRRIHAVQGEGTIRGGTESREIFLEEQRGSQCAVGEVTGRRRCDGSLRSRTSTSDWISSHVVTERVLV